MLSTSGLSRPVFLAAILFCLTPWCSPPIALALGIALALLLANPYAKVGRTASRLLLQASVVLLGFSMNFGVVVRAGAEGAVLAAATIALTLALGFAIGRLLAINGRTSTLISGGTAICGGSAIAALAAVIGAAEGEIAVAIGTVFILNAVGLYLFPVLGHALELSPEQFGVWAAVSIHDVSSVVGAATSYGSPVALETATAVKLSRALWIVPLTLGVLAVMRWRESRARAAATVNGALEGDASTASGATAAPRAAVQIPWFIGFFLLASLSRSLLPAIEEYVPLIKQLATIGLSLTLFLIGASISLPTLRAVGWRPMAQGVILWIFISAVTLGVVLLGLV